MRLMHSVRIVVAQLLQNIMNSLIVLDTDKISNYTFKPVV